jgi:adenylate cyclase
MRRSIKGILLGLILATVTGLFGLSIYGTVFERNTGLNWLFQIRGELSPPPESAVIAINGFTGEKLGIPALPREWPRSIHGELVDALVKLGVSTIVFDVDFHKPRSEKDEKLFAEAVDSSQRVVMFQRLTGKRKPIEDSTGKIRGSVWIEELLSPVPVLEQAARGMGPFPLPKFEAQVYEFWVFKSSAREAPTMPAVAFQLHALKAYIPFLRLLKSAGVTKYVNLPDTASDIANAKDLHRIMTGIRDTLTEHPALAGKLIQLLASPWLQQETAENRKLLQSLVMMYTGDNERYLNFYGPPGTIKTLPFHAIIKGEDPNIPAEDFDLTNQVAFVGLSDFYDPGQPDRFYTVFTDDQGVDLSGVEIAATAFANLLNNQSLQIPDPLTTFIILFMFGLFMALLVYFTPAIIGVPLSIALTAGYIVYAQLSFNDSYLWLPLATPVLIQYPLALFVGLLAQYLQQRHKVKHISEAISYYVPEDVSKALTSNAFDPHNINQVTFSTCLATDMQGFSTLAEKMNPGELASFLNDYFDSLAAPLRNHDVTITEFRADAIMCAWTGKETDIEVRKNPILASLEAADAIEDFKARHDAFDASLRIGMETGEVYVGHSGGGGHFVYSIVGDCANTASRIEGLNKHVGTQILATQSVLEGIDDDLLTRPIGKFVFVGKSEPLPIIEILASNSNATARQLELCERFAQGMELFEQADWTAASDVYKTILKDFPHDGPCRFYHSQCQTRLKAEALPENPSVINMTSK